MGLRDGFGQQITENYAFRGFFKTDKPCGTGTLLVNNLLINGDFTDDFKSKNALCKL